MLETTTRVRIRRGGLLACGALALLVVGCQVVAGISSRSLDPPPPDGVCNFPSYLGYDGPLVRVANLVPTNDVVDVCMRPSGSSSWGRPLLFDGGTACPQGFAYAEVSDKFNAPSATIDVKLIAGGGSCSDPGLTEGDGLSLASDSVNTLARIGGNGVAQTIVALPEANSVDSVDIRLRFVNAMPGVGALDFGNTTVAHLPASIQTPMLDKPVPFGQAPTTGQKTVTLGALDSHGYDRLLTAALDVVAQPHGKTKGVLLQPVTSNAATYSLYAIGVAGDNAHPQRGLLCQEDAPAKDFKEPCTLSPLPTISVDVWNPGLYGPNSPYNTQRDPATLANLVAQRDSDVICLVEVDSAADQAAFKAAATAYPYVYAGPQMSLSTPFSDPRDENGNVPSAPTTPPCGGNVKQSDVDAAFQCMEEHCSNKQPGDPSGVLDQSTDCLASNCAGPIVQVQSESSACYDCMIDYVATGAESYGDAEQQCLTNPEPPLGFDGLNNSMILSRYPLQNTDAWVLPSTNYRRSILYAQVKLEDQDFDFYCGFLMSDGIAQDLPYEGSYGDAKGESSCDPTTTECYDNEQSYEATQLVGWAKKKSAPDAEYPKGRPAILVGDWRASSEFDAPGADGGSVQLVEALNPATMDHPGTMDVLNAAFTAVSPTSWTPQCNFCPSTPSYPMQLTNPYNGPKASYFVSQPFLANWPGDAKTAGVDMSIIFTSPTAVTLPGNTTGPASPYYGVNVHVLRPNATGGM